MSVSTFESSILHLKDIISGINNSKSQDLATTRSLYVSLSKILDTAKDAQPAELVANTNLNALEEVFSGRYVSLSKGVQTLVISIYSLILATTPGYAVRNVVNNLLLLCANKNITSGARECAAGVIGSVMLKRALDCGSMINDIITNMSKLVKGSDHGLRIVSLQSLTMVVLGAGPKIGDCHPELIKLATKVITDRSADIRHAACQVVTEVAKASSGCTSVPMDLLLAAVVKGLEDEVVAVQEASANVVAIIYNEQIEAYLEEQEQAKIGQARGGASESDSDPSPRSSARATQSKGSLARLKEMASSSRTKVIEDYDFKSVVKHIISLIVKANVALRAGYTMALSNLIRIRIQVLDNSELEWLLKIVIEVMHDTSICALTYEELVYFRSRLAHLLRTAVTSNLSENAQVSFALLLTQFATSPESHTEHELQLVLGELGNVVTALGEAAISIVDEVKTAANIQLKNASFGVRAAAAYVLAGLTSVIPAVAAGCLRDSLTQAKEQVRLLTTYDGTDLSFDKDVDMANSDASVASNRKKSPKDTERLQRMFCFHGHTLVISIFLKNERWMPTGLPKDLSLDVFDFGLELLKQDVMSAPPGIRHVICSVIRAGSLIVSSCLNMGYKIARLKIPVLLRHCKELLQVSSSATSTSVLAATIPTVGSSSPTPAAVPPSTSAANGSSSASVPSSELLYELMSVEAALVCISTLLWFCPEALIYDENCLLFIVEGLENAFRAVKSRYQSKFRSHFRFRALHVLLLECFAWLPPGSFPATCQQLFVEALRVFRDSISAGYESTCLSEFVRPEFAILNVIGLQRPSGTTGYEMPLNEAAMMLKLEQHAAALQKKESEAFLASFSKDVKWGDFHQGPLQTNAWAEPAPPCAHIDSRTVNAAIALLASTFGHQSNEYQDKAMQLFSQVVAQFLKASSSMGLFSSEEERRKKDRRGFVTVKNVISALSAIVRSFPFHSGMSLDLDLVWVQSVADRMFEMLTYPNVDIRSAASNSLGIFCSKIYGSSLMENMASKIASTIRGALEKKADSMSDCLGYLVALSCLWEHSKDMPDIQSSISSVIFDCLKKVDCTLSFRSFSVFAMSIIVKNREVGQSMHDVNETLKMITRVCQVAETHLVCVGTANDTASFYEQDLLLVCIQRLINYTVPIVLDVDPTSNVMSRFVHIWEIIRSSSTNALVQRETMDFIVMGCLFPPGVTSLDRMLVAKYLQNALERRVDSSCTSLHATVEAVRALMLQDADVACQAGLDMELFKLLDWCIASSTVTCATSYWGLELRSGIEASLGSTRTLQRRVEIVLDSLVSIEVKQNPDTRAAHWVLLCRAVALGLRTGAGGDGDAGNKDMGHGDGDADGETFTPASGKSKGGQVAAAVSNSMTYQAFSTWAKDRAVEKAQGLAATRVRVKCVAVQCATTALIGVISDPVHADLAMARSSCQTFLDSLGPTPGDSTLETLPCFVPLFLHDFVNFACACATFSIEDNRILSLQASSSEFLECLVAMYWSCFDPDAIIGLEQQDNNRILQQFVSQIVSAIRTCLVAEWHPSLSATAGGLACDLMRGGFVTDKTIIRRVAKLLVPSYFTPTSGSERPPLSSVVRAPLSLHVADEVSTIGHIVAGTNVARLYLLTSAIGPLRHVHEDVKSTLHGLLDENIGHLVEVWYAIAVDAARVLQGERQWPKPTEQTDARIGGLTYGSSVDPAHLVGHLETAVTYVLAALALCPSLDKSRVVFVFSVAQIVLEDLGSFHNTTGSVGSEKSGIGIGSAGLKKNRAKRMFLEDLVISTFASVATSHNEGFQHIQVNQWIQLVSHMIVRIMPARLQDLKRLTVRDICSLSASFLDVFEPLAARLAEFHPEGETGLLSVLRIGVLSIALTGLEAVFQSDTSLQSIYNGSLPAIRSCPTEPIPSDQAVKLQQFVEMGILHRLMCTSVSVSMTSPALKAFMVRLLACLVLYVAYLIPLADAKQKILDQLNEHICALCVPNGDINLSSEVTAGSSCEELSGADAGRLLMENLLLWREAAVAGRVSIVAPTPVHSRKMSMTALSPASIYSPAAPLATASLEGPVSVVPAVLLAWRSLAGITPGLMRVPTQLASIMLGPGSIVSTDSGGSMFEFQKATLIVVLKIMQAGSGTVGAVLANALLPAAITGVTHAAQSSNEATETLLLQLIFVTFDLIPETSRESYLKLVLSPLCGCMTRRPVPSPVAVLCANKITQLARLCPDVFRAQVASMSEANRLTLQSSMRYVLELQSSASSSGSNSISDGTSSIKKIDMSKYRKS